MKRPKRRKRNHRLEPRSLENARGGGGGYANSLPFSVAESRGLGTDLWLFDADGDAV